MLTTTLLCLLLLVATTLLHYEVLTLLALTLDRLHWPRRLKVVAAVLGCFFGHALGVLLYALGLWWLVQGDGGLGGLRGGAAIPGFAEALYFSAEAYTSLGLGDVTPYGSVRLLAGVEALNGLLLIAWSASFLYLEMERYWKRRHP